MLEKYEEIAGFNLEGYYFIVHKGIRLQEFIPTKSNFEELPQKEGYSGVCFIFDNIEKIVWIFQDDDIKTKKFVKSIKNETKEKKLAELTVSIFANELNYDITNYEIKRATIHGSSFLEIFKYQINQYPLYQQHYLLPEYEDLEKEKEKIKSIKEDSSANIKKCANCGWIISANLTVCPKCHRSPREKFEGKKSD
ncbi:MAG: hypothetical protein ACTSQJ_12000 [Promethearchaeota archaeon]